MASFSSHPLLNLRKMDGDVERAILREVHSANLEVIQAYLVGATHDATANRTHKTLRFAQRGLAWLEVLRACLRRLGHRSWSYEEGSRGVFVLETCWRPPSLAPIAAAPEAYARGYFDAEGGVPHSPDARFYIQFVQKDRMDLDHLRTVLSSLAIECGRVHNPSVRVDRDYWRFYVSTSSHQRFANRVSSWHPARRPRLERVLGPVNTQSERLDAY